MTALVDFTSLIHDFAELRAHAGNLQTPNVEDHHQIRMAMVGFARSSDVTHWEYHHYEFIQNRLDSDLSIGLFSAAWIEFSCLAMGYLLGLVDSGQIEKDSEFRIADAQLPGFMWVHAAEIERLNVNADGT